VKSLLVAPVGAIFTVKVLVPPAVPVLGFVTPVTTAVISFTSMVLASPTLNSVENVTMSLLPPSERAR
jgi:ABC-type maltose transport system permease subunit